MAIYFFFLEKTEDWGSRGLGGANVTTACCMLTDEQGIQILKTRFLLHLLQAPRRQFVTPNPGDDIDVTNNAMFMKQEGADNPM